jgi:hypothetical protein
VKGVKIALVASLGATVASLSYAQNQQRSFSTPGNSPVLQYHTAPVYSSVPPAHVIVPSPSNPYPKTDTNTNPTVAIPPIPANTNNQGTSGASQVSYGNQSVGTSGYTSSLPAGSYAPPLTSSTPAGVTPQAAYAFRCVVNTAGDYCTGAAAYVFAKGTACMCGQYNGRIQ